MKHLEQLPNTTRIRNAEITQRIRDICLYWLNENLRRFAKRPGAEEFYGETERVGLQHINDLVGEMRLEDGT